MILSRRLSLFLDLFYLFSSLLLIELKLLLKTDFLFLSSRFSSLNLGLTFNFIILSYLDSLLYTDTKLLLLAFFSFKHELLDRIELFKLFLLLQNEKSRLRLEELLDAEDVYDKSRLLLDLEPIYGWTQYFRGYKSS